MSDIQIEDAWRLYRTVLRERDQARAELDMLRLLTLDLMRERDQSRTVARDCYEALRRVVGAEARSSQERREEVERLGDRVRRTHWVPEAPVIDGGLAGEARCRECGLRLMGSGPCLLCGAGDGLTE